MTMIPGGEFLTTSLNVISQSLLIPVIIVLLVFVVLSIIMAGGLISEYTTRKRVPVSVIREGIFKIDNAGSVDEVKSIVGALEVPNSQKRILGNILGASDLDSVNREALARKFVEHEEENMDNILQKSDIITRIGPTLGLMGTLIPLGPGLAALGGGDINTLSAALIVAFDTTVTGIGAGALCYVISKVRRGWYDQYLSDLDALSDAVLDFMSKS